MWWSLEDPSVNGPDYMPGRRWAEDEEEGPHLCTCQTCENEYEEWIDKAGTPITWCCESCWIQGEA